MELDFKTVKALSSPTRIRILNQVLEKEATPTSLSRELDKSKSTISSHLETLSEAGLVEKDEKEGRKRVNYFPTRKTEHIVEGRERTVKFTLTSSVVSGIAGLALLGTEARKFFSLEAGYQEQSSADAMTSLSMEAGKEAAEAAPAADASMAILLLGLGLVSASVLAFLYGLTVRKLGE